MHQPPYLKKNDRVAIVAPAKKVNRPEMQMAIQILEGWGLEVVLGKYVFNIYNQFAGTDRERAEDLQNMLDDPSIQAIICARGGYGTTRIIDSLSFDSFLAQPKWLVGFSDITVLHCHIHNLGVCSIHGIMPMLFPKQTEQTLESLRRALFGEPLHYESLAHPLNRLGKARGELVGGNLSLFANTIGTPSEIDTRDKILFLEDVNEYLYHLDRMMIHLYRAGKLAHLAGLIIGEFSQVKDNEAPFGWSVHEIIAELVAEYNYPVCYDFPVGHEVNNLSMYCGGIGTLAVQESGISLSFSPTEEWMAQDF